jgi:iron complex outermembrane recepter protein
MLSPHVSAPLAVVALCSTVVASAATTVTAPAEKRTFNLPRGDAAVTLKEFATAAGTPIVYLVDRVRGITTHAVSGEFTPRETLDRMLAGSALEAAQDSASGALVVSRKRTAEAAPKVGEVGPVSDPKPKPPGKPMKTSRTLLAALAGWLAAGDAADAQTATPPPKAEAVVLSPFNVNSDRDYGYVATNTLAGTRVNTPVKDVGAQVSIFTKDFIKDVGATNLEELMGYAIGTQKDLTEESATGGVFNSNGLKTPVASFRVRGITGVGRARNYFVWPGGEIDFSTTERVDFSRGPNSILFGLGSPAGIFNLATKQADLNRSFANFEVRTSNFLQRRASADINAASRDKRLAVRFVPLFDHAPTWREHEYRERNGIYGAATFAATGKTTIRADVEKARIDQTLLGRPWTALDGTSYWEDAGKPILAASAYTVATNPTTGITSATPTNLVVTPQSGFMREWTRTATPVNTYSFVFNPATGYAANWAPMPIGYGPLFNAGASAYVRSANNQISSDSRYALNRIPRTASLIGAELPATHEFTTGSVYVEQRLLPSLVLEAAYNRTLVRRNNYDIGWNFTSLAADASGLLPDGRPNPNAGRYFLESQVTQFYSDEQVDSFRGMASYTLDLNRRNKWLGRYAIAGMAERRDSFTAGGTARETIYDGAPLPGPNVTDLRNSVFRRAYVDPDNPNTLQFPDFRATPIANVLDASRGVRVNAAMLPIGANRRQQITETQMFVGQAYLLRDYLVGTFGRRKDKIRQTNFDTVLRTVGDLTNVPSAVLNPNLVDRFSGDTETKGLVLHPLKWLSLFYNQSSNFNIQGTNNRIFSENPVGSAMVRVAPNSDGSGKDFGVRLDGLLGDRVFLTFNRFENTGDNIVGGGFPSTNGRFRNLIYAIYYSNPSALAGTGLVEAFNSVLNSQNNTVTSGGTTFSRVSKGTEVEFTANVTKQWRLAAAYSRSKTVISNVSPEIRNLIALYTPLFTRADLAPLRYTDPNVNSQIGGGSLGAPGMAVPDMTPVPSEEQRDYFASRGTSNIGVGGTVGINTVGEAWQNFLDLQEEQNFIREGQRPSGEVPEQFSLRTSYTFRESLRGFTFGGGIRWQAGAVLGALATRADANGVLRPIVPLASRPTIRGDAVFLTDLNLGYQRKIMRGRVVWEIQCNVSNVLNNRERIPTTIFGDGLVRYYRWNEPRRITLNSSFGF